MKRWIKRILAVLALLLVAALGYGVWEFGHPAMPAGSQVLASSAAPAGGVAVHYFGTTTLAFDDGHDAVMVDALLSRPGITTALFGKVASDPARIDDALRKAALSKLDLLPEKQAGGYRALDAMERHLDGRAYLVGDSPTLADISLYAYTHVADEAGLELERYPAIGAWLDKVAALPGHIAITA